MVSQRNRSLEIIEYLKTLGIEVNLGKNKARGNKGIFITSNGNFRIDVSKDLPEEQRLAVIIHEFSHYIHFKQDRTLKSLDFIFKHYNSELEEELISVTVQGISKEFATSLFCQKEKIKKEIRELSEIVKNSYSGFKISEPNKIIEKSFQRPLNYLLKYDKIKVFLKNYSIDALESDFPELTSAQRAYIRLKSKQRLLKRINARISKINRYYNKPTELFARFAEMFFTNPVLAKELAPTATLCFQSAVDKNKIPELSAFASFF